MQPQDDQLNWHDMDYDLRRRMLDYYHERAPEYGEAFTLGTGTSSHPNVSTRHDVRQQDSDACDSTI